MPTCFATPVVTNWRMTDTIPAHSRLISVTRISRTPRGTLSWRRIGSRAFGEISGSPRRSSRRGRVAEVQEDRGCEGFRLVDSVPCVAACPDGPVFRKPCGRFAPQRRVLILRQGFETGDKFSPRRNRISEALGIYSPPKVPERFRYLFFPSPRLKSFCRSPSKKVFQ